MKKLCMRILCFLLVLIIVIAQASARTGDQDGLDSEADGQGELDDAELQALDTSLEDLIYILNQCLESHDGYFIESFSLTIGGDADSFQYEYPNGEVLRGLADRNRRLLRIEYTFPCLTMDADLAAARRLTISGCIMAALLDIEPDTDTVMEKLEWMLTQLNMVGATQERSDRYAQGEELSAQCDGLYCVRQLDADSGMDTFTLSAANQEEVSAAGQGAEPAESVRAETLEAGQTEEESGAIRILLIMMLLCLAAILLWRVCRRKKQPECLYEAPVAAEPAVMEEKDILAEIELVNDAIEDKKVSSQIDQIRDITKKILDYQAKRPEKADQLHSFLSYYLPTTLKILRAYGELEKQGISGQNITGAMERIENMMEKVTEGFEQQLDQLYQGETMDINADVEVLEQMMARDGLTVDRENPLQL